MDPVDDSFDDLFDFDLFDNNGQDVTLIADQHLFGGGPGFFSVNPPVTNNESVGLPSSGYPVEQFAHGGLEDYIGLPTSGRVFFDNGLDVFTGGNFDTDSVDLAPRDGPVSEFMTQQYDGHGLTYTSALQNNPGLLPLLVEPATLSDQTQSFRHVVLATPEVEQQWQAFQTLQTRLQQPAPQVSQDQPTQTVQQWGDVGNGLGLNLRSPFESPVNGPTPAIFQGLPEVAMPQDLGQQAILSDEQIHRLRHPESGENVPPSVEVAPANNSISQAGSSSQTSQVSRNTSTPRHSSSSRIATATPEPVPQHDQLPQTELAGLTFASLKDAEAAMPSRYIENDWESPSPDATIPKTQDERAAYVLQMFQAFQDTSVCKDNKNGHSFIKRWKTRGYYNLTAMEKVCWHMLDIAEHLHDAGPSSTVMYCEEALKKLKGSRTLIFQQRINSICAMLRFSKYLCDQLMKGEGLEALIGAPRQKMSGATTMQVQNQRRQKWIVHGRTEDPIEEKGKIDGHEQSRADEAQPAHQEKSKAKRATPEKSRAIAKTRSSKISRYDSSDEEESVHRRQSETGISTEPQQAMNLQPSPALRSAYATSLVPASSRRGLRELRMAPYPVASSPTAPESPLSLTSLTRPSSATPGPSTGLRKVGQGDTNSVQGSSAVGPGEDHEDEHDGVGEDEGEMADVASPSRSPSPTRKRKMEKAATKGEIQMIHPLIMTANRATKPVPNSNKRKAQEESDLEETSSSEEDEPPFAKRTKRSGGAIRKPTMPAEPVATRNTRNKSLPKKASMELHPESESEAEPTPATSASGRLARVNRRNAEKAKTFREKAKASRGKAQNSRK